LDSKVLPESGGKVSTDVWDKIAEKAFREACAVKCSLAEFKQGLNRIAERFAEEAEYAG
jgi:hypothetical protein